MPHISTPRCISIGLRLKLTKFLGFEGATGNPTTECYTARRLGLPGAGLVLGTGFHREVTMEQVQEVFTGPALYLTVIWGVVTAIFLVLVAWRSVLSSHEDDQIFIDAAQSTWRGSSASW